MKLLLTSNGLSNQSIANALFELVGKAPSDTVVAFVPTAMNVVLGDKSWFVNDLANLKKQGLKCLDVVDISALPSKVFLPRLEEADVLFFCGGNTSHLMNWLKKTKLARLLPALLKSRVYAGISAGSIVAAPSLFFSSKDKKLYYEEVFNYHNEEGLGFVPFHIRPHLNSPDFPHTRVERIQELAKAVHERVYALDDQSALKVVDGLVEVISEGEYRVFNS